MNKPLPLKDLPAYLDSIKRNGNMDDSIVVDMGQIITTKPNNWAISFALSSAIALLLLVGVATYKSTNNITITASDLSVQDISKIVTEEGGRVISVTSNEDDAYQVKLLSWNLKNLLEKLKKRKEIKIEINN